MSSNPGSPSTTFTFRRLAAAVVTMVLLLGLADRATVGARGIWRLADYRFEEQEFWPDALRVGRTLHTLPDAPPPRWLIAGSSIVLYGVIPHALADGAAADGQRPHVAKLAVPRAVVTDGALLTQLAHNRAPLQLAILGVHIRAFDVTEDPRTTLIARIFDRAGIDVEPLKGGTPARRFERTLATLWFAFRVRRLQTRVFHALVPNPAMLQPSPTAAPAAPLADFDWEDAPLTDNLQRDELVSWMTWCTEHGIRPVVVYFPERPGDGARPWPKSHAEAWVSNLEREVWGRGIFIDARDAAPAEDFFDFNHLHEAGAVRFSTWLGRHLRESLHDTPDRTRQARIVGHAQ